MWVVETEVVKFWLQVVTELKNRGVQGIFIACVDGLKGFPEAIEAGFPKNRCNFVSSIWCATPCGTYHGSSGKKWRLT